MFDKKKCLERWKLGTEVRARQLVREREDLEFQVPELMWDEDARKQRQASVVGNVAVPARPCLSIPKLLQPLNIIRNQMAEANLGITISPRSPDAETDTAEVYQDLYRTIENDPDAPASHARNWAFDRGLQAGTGWYRVNTTYDESSPDPFDQKIVIERILYQDSVIIDPAATKADYSDAQWAFVSYWKALDAFMDEFPETEVAKESRDSEIGFDFDTIETIVPGWVKANGDTKSIQLGEYFEKSYQSIEIPSPDGKKKRIKQKCIVTRYLVCPGTDGLEVIEEVLWNGPDIPLIPVIGVELQPFDNERRIYGLVRPVRDSAKAYNYAATALLERAAMEPKAPFVVDIEQIEGFEKVWREANTRALPYLPYKSVIRGGSLLGPPHRTPVDASTMSPSLIMLEQTDQMIQDSSATPNPVLGKARKDQSGKAIAALQGQSEVSNSGFIGNFSMITMRYEAKVIMGMIPNVYDRPGRIAQIEDGNGEFRKVMLNAPHIMDANGNPVRTDQAGRPMPPQGMNTTHAPMMAQPGQMPKLKIYDFSKGIYGVTVSVEKSRQSQLQEGSEQLAQFIEQDPELGVVLAPLFLHYQTWSGAKEAAELAKEYRETKYPNIGKSKDGQKTPDELQAELNAAQGQLQQLQQQNQAMQQQIQTDQAKQQASLQKAQIDAQASAQAAQVEAHAAAQLSQMEAQLKIRLEQMDEQAALRLQAMKEEAETQRLMIQQKFDAMQAALDRQQADKMAQHQAEQAENAEERQDMRGASEAAESQDDDRE